MIEEKYPGRPGGRSPAGHLARWRSLVRRPVLVLVLDPRGGEVLGVVWDQIDFDEGELYVGGRLPWARMELILREVKVA